MITCNPSQNATHATHASTTSTPPTQARHPSHRRQHVTHAGSPPSPPTVVRHSHKHASQATHASTNSTPFLKHGSQVSVFRQKQYIKDKITIASLKNINENKILSFIQNLKVLAGITQKRAVKALFSLWSLKKRKLIFIEKVKNKRF